MELNHDQRGTVDDWLLLKAQFSPCTLCHAPNIASGRLVEGLPGYGGGGDPKPMVELVCGNCGHVSLFDAETMGLA